MINEKKMKLDEKNNLQVEHISSGNPTSLP